MRLLLIWLLNLDLLLVLLLQLFLELKLLSRYEGLFLSYKIVCLLLSLFLGNPFLTITCDLSWQHWCFISDSEFLKNSNVFGFDCACSESMVRCFWSLSRHLFHGFDSQVTRLSECLVIVSIEEMLRSRNLHLWRSSRRRNYSWKTLLLLLTFLGLDIFIRNWKSFSFFSRKDYRLIVMSNYSRRTICVSSS